jgi:uncharacterized protein YjbI with pentapeptide repeats
MIATLENPNIENPTLENATLENATLENARATGAVAISDAGGTACDRVSAVGEKRFAMKRLARGFGSGELDGATPTAC